MRAAIVAACISALACASCGYLLEAHARHWDKYFAAGDTPRNKYDIIHEFGQPTETEFGEDGCQTLVYRYREGRACLSYAVHLDHVLSVTSWESRACPEYVDPDGPPANPAEDPWVDGTRRPSIGSKKLGE